MEVLRHVHRATDWRADVDAAQADLDATGARAGVLAAHAPAWRTATATLPVAQAATGAFVLVGEALAVALLVVAFVGLLGPQVLASVLTFPVMWVATLQACHHGLARCSAPVRVHDLRLQLLRLSGTRSVVRVVRWGAMTREERVLSNPGRARVHVTASEQTHGA